MTKHLFSTIKVGLFFDGTGNNGYNSTAVSPITDSSYQASPSNIFRLYNNYLSECTANKNMIGVYVEGIGTLTDQVDSTFDQATGDWSRYYGASSKIEFATERIHQELTQLFAYNNCENDITLEFNIFGFSRGAALARHFANQLSKTTSELYIKINRSLNKSQKELKKITINFIGLFDTVESFLQGKYDTSISTINANCIYQLRAMHECRVNFPFTSILDKATGMGADKSGGGYLDKPNRFELTVPGCHADIGGGYLNHIIETKSITCTNFEKESKEQVAELQRTNLWGKLIDNNNISYYNYPFPGYSYAISKRNDVLAELQWVYGILMLETAIKFECPFNKNTFLNIYQLPDDLSALYKELVVKNDLLLNKKQSDPISKNTIDSITQKYIHISANWDYISKSQIGPSTEPIKLENNKHSIAQEELITNIQASVRANEPEKNWIRKIKYQ